MCAARAEAANGPDRRLRNVLEAESAVGAAGGTVTETIISAYRTGR
jgi:hypothetical protein